MDPKEFMKAVSADLERQYIESEKFCALIEERARQREILAAFPDDHEFAINMIVQCKDLVTAQKEYEPIAAKKEAERKRIEHDKELYARYRRYPFGVSFK